MYNIKSHKPLVIIALVCLFILISFKSQADVQLVQDEMTNRLATVFAEERWGYCEIVDNIMFYEPTGDPAVLMYILHFDSNEFGTVVVAANRNHMPLIESHKGLPRWLNFSGNFNKLKADINSFRSKNLYYFAPTLYFRKNGDELLNLMTSSIYQINPLFPSKRAQSEEERKREEERRTVLVQREMDFSVQEVSCIKIL